MQPLPRLVCGDKPTGDLVRRSKRKRGAGVLDAMVRFRALSAEQQAWTRAAAAAGYLSLSDWIRDRLNAAAKNRALFSSEDESTCTPPIVFEWLSFLGRLALDPCSNERSIVPAAISLRLPESDGLTADWLELVRAAGGGWVFVNPPFGAHLPAWVAKCAAEAARGVEIVMLVPARTETQWFNDLSGADIALLRGRLTFLDAPSTAPFPVCFPHFAPSPERRALFRHEMRPRCTRILEAA